MAFPACIVTRVSVLLVGCVLAALLSVPSSASEHETFVVEGKELTDCSLPALICYDVVAGDPATDIRAGERVLVTLRAAGEAPHNINVIEESGADALHVDTPVGEAIASSSTVGAGLETTLQFVAPAEGTVLYFWCDVVEHEVAGMYFTATVGAPLAPGESAGNGSTDGPTTQDGNLTGGNETEADGGAGGQQAADNGTAEADAEVGGGVGAGNDTAAEDEAMGNATTNDAGSAEESPHLGFIPVAVTIGVAVAVHRRRRP